MATSESSTQVRIPAHLSKLVPNFLTNRAKDLDIARGSLASAEWDQLAMIGHRLYGTAASYGFTALGEIGRRIEEAAGRQSATETAEQLQAWQAYLAQLDVVYID